jgi:hypothetical protein
LNGTKRRKGIIYGITVFLFRLPNLSLTILSGGSGSTPPIVRVRIDGRCWVWSIRFSLLSIIEQGEGIRLISARIADEDERRIYNGERDPGSWRKAN